MAWRGKSFSEILSSIHPFLKILIVIATVTATIASIISGFGPKVLIALAAVGFFGIFWKIYQMSRRTTNIEKALISELPNNHQFLVEFLRTTYFSNGKTTIISKNIGASIHTYQHYFNVKDQDCTNKQVIKGRNISDIPLRGIAFALVGGSSMSTSSLSSRFKINGSSKSEPLFLIDNDRFKVPFCSFQTPLNQNKEFHLEYSDYWQGAMRKEADAFFFPEAMYFPDKIGELFARLEFSFKIASLAALEVNTENFNVETCKTQPKETTPSVGMIQAFDWSKLSPPTNSIFILYYHAK